MKMEVSIAMGVPKNGGFIMENPFYKWMIWGYPYVRKPPREYISIKHLFLDFEATSERMVLGF